MMLFTVSKRTGLLSSMVLAMSLCAVLGSQAAQAQEDHRVKLRQVCAEDFKKYCSDVQPGGGRIRECMMSNVDKVSSMGVMPSNPCMK